MSTKATKRWFSTGFMAGGVGAVDPEKHVLRDAVVIRPGEAKTHGLWIDQEFCGQVLAAGEASGDKGIKARFGHPNMCSEALGTFLGRWKALRADDAGRVIGDLYLSSTAAESPKGDLRKYIEELAAKEPEHFGASIVFGMDEEAIDAFTAQHGGDSFASPDPANGQNLPHARLSELHAADLVDDPAATDGMFSGAAGQSLAGQVTEWLDLHPEVLRAFNDEPEMLDLIERYSDELKPFMERYAANHNLKPAAESATDPVPDPALAESIVAKDAEIASLQAVLSEAQTEGQTIKAAHDELTAKTETLAADIDRLTGELAGAVALRDQWKTERDAALDRIKAIESGATPVSGRAAGEQSELTPWQRAQKKG